MSTQGQIKFIREKCIEANPDIKKLEFGCQIIVMNDVRRYVVSLEPQSKYNLVFIGGSVNGRNTFTEDEYIVIGRDIRLADVLLSLARVSPNPELTLHSIEVSIAKRGTHGRDNCTWNLLKDRLEDQSPDTIEFIYNLLK